HAVVPDLSTFGKAMANGFALAALVGKREITERGGLTHSHERVFLLSTTHGAETHSLAAGIATMQVYRSMPVIETLYEQGDPLRAVIAENCVVGFVNPVLLSSDVVLASSVGARVKARFLDASFRLV